MLALSRGALATSGDARRFLLKEIIGHVLDARTGWPVRRPALGYCRRCDLHAGRHLLDARAAARRHAEEFLRTQGVEYWTLR